MKELLTSTDFRLYRKKQLEVFVSLVKAHFFDDPLRADYLAGLIEMGRRMIRLPEDLITDNAHKAQLGQQVQEDLNRMVVEMTREAKPENIFEKATTDTEGADYS